MKETDKLLEDKKYIQINQILFSIVNNYESRLQKEITINNKPLSISEKGIIMILGQFEPINSRQLSLKMDINPGTISLYVERLVKKKLVSRKRDKEDRRTWWLTLTETGQREYSETHDGSIKYTSDILSALSKSEQVEFHKLLLKVSQHNTYEW